MIKLGKPKAGWITIEIEEDMYHASYLTDVPMDLINACIATLKNNIPFILEIDTEENGIYSIVNSPLQRDLLIVNGPETKVYKYLEPLDLISYIFKYLTENKEDLYNWFLYEDELDEKEKYKKELEEGLIKLEELIETKLNGLIHGQLD